MSANTTLKAAILAGYDGLSPRDVMLCVLQGAQGGGAGGVTFGNYAGGTPSPAPASGTGLFVDTSNQNLWSYDGGAFHLIV